MDLLQLLERLHNSDTPWDSARLSRDNQLTYGDIPTTIDLREISHAKAEFIMWHVVLLAQSKRDGVAPDADVVAEIRTLPEPIQRRIVDAGLLEEE
jgi:hypothetical protein